MYETVVLNKRQLASVANRLLQDENAKLRATNLIQAAQIHDLNTRIAELTHSKYTPIIRNLERRPV